MNLIIDFSFLAYRTVYTCINDNKYFLSKPEEQRIFVMKLHQDLLALLDRFNCYSVNICLDSKRNWRTKIYNDYKMSREKNRDDNDKIDFKEFYRLIDVYIEWLSKNTEINIFKIDTFEADDLIYIVNNLLKKNNESSIIITADKDLYQLIGVDGITYTAIYKPIANKNVLYVNTDINDKMKNEINILTDDGDFPMGIINDSYESSFLKLKNWCDKNAIEVEIVEPMKVLFDKIFHKETSDELGDITEGLVLEKKFTRRITKKVIEMLDDMNFTWNNLVNNLKNSLYKNVWLDILKDKLKLDNEQTDKVLENFDIKVQLVELNLKNYPEEQIQILKNYQMVVYDFVSGYPFKRYISIDRDSKNKLHFDIFGAELKEKEPLIKIQSAGWDFDIT